MRVESMVIQKYYRLSTNTKLIAKSRSIPLKNVFNYFVIYGPFMTFNEL